MKNNLLHFAQCRKATAANTMSIYFKIQYFENRSKQWFDMRRSATGAAAERKVLWLMKTWDRPKTTFRIVKVVKVVKVVEEVMKF